MGSWRDVCDGSDAADTPVMAKAGLRVGVVIVLVGVAVAVLVGWASDRGYPKPAALLILPLGGVGLAVGSWLNLRRLRRRGASGR